ncbi:hypothetical protein [Kitasatospora sp. NPDC093679]|uniref:hypothetical protein n=1 Tax=Kitasatospora sp. NPDC093679 TaxID=3154983 RepID=UPI003449499C
MSGSHRATSHVHPADVPGPRSSADGQAPRPRGHRRKAKPKRRGGKALMGGTAVLLAATAGWFTVGQGRSLPSFTSAGAAERPEADTTHADIAPLSAGGHTEGPSTADRSDRTDGTVAAIPGLGPSFLARIPAETKQVVVASGKDKDSADTVVTLWTRTPDGRWRAGQAWAAHNGYKGWSAEKRSGDLHSPIGVFGLTDAGGRKADPGSKLPYDKDPNFVVGGKGFNGEPLAGSFDYVVAINYNRVAGRSPLDTASPEGKAKGGGVWLHVDHGGPTHACVSLPEANMIELIRALDPAAHPVIAMGDAAALAV